MKKSLFLVLLPAVLLVAGCSFVKDDKTSPAVNAPAINSQANTQSNVCEIPVTSSTTIVNAKTGLPPVSQEEKNKTFTYEDVDMGVKMKYPGSCYFNKGAFQCSDFSLSIWLLDDGTKASATPKKTFKDNETQIEYTYSHNKKVYSLLAWYDGADRSDLDLVIDKIAKTLTFTK